MKIALSLDSLSPYDFGTCVLACAILFLISALPASAHAQGVYAPLTASSLVSLANADRALHQVSLLAEDKMLDAAAQKKADDMMAQGYFSHTTPDGKNPWYWLRSIGYYYTHAGENLASDFNNPVTVEQAWMASPLHRANILGALYTRVGIGISHGFYRGKETTFVVQFFTTPYIVKTTPAALS